MKAGELLGKQLEKLGVDTTSEELKAVLGISIEVPDAIAIKMDGLMTEEGAKNSSKLKGHFISAFADGLEKNVFDKMKDFGLSDEQIVEIKNVEKSSGKRIETALEKLVATKEKAAKAKKDGDTDSEKAYKEQIDKLIKDLNDTKELSKKEIENLKNSNEQENINSEVAREFLGRNWSKAQPDSVDDRIGISLLHLNNKLQQLDAKLVREPGTKKLKLVQAKNPELEYLDGSNNKVNFTSLISEIGTEKKLFAVSAPAGQGTSTTIVADQTQQGTIRTNNPTLNALRASQQDQAQNLA